jgi:site-specific recombinase XerC
LKINRFLDTIKGLSPNTVSAYRQTLWLLWTYMKKQNGSLPKSAEPTEENIKRFLEMYNGASLHRHKAAIKRYLEYLGEDWPFTPQLSLKPCPHPFGRIKWLDDHEAICLKCGAKLSKLN